MRYRIDEACNEDWDAMAPHETGRFCQRCQHAVVDATEMTKREFAAFFEEAEGDVCAQVRANPLGDSVFRRELTKPRPLGSFVLLSTLLASACGSETAVEPLQVPLEAPGCQLVDDKVPGQTPLESPGQSLSPSSAESVDADAGLDSGVEDAAIDAAIDRAPPPRQRLRGRIRRHRD